MLADHFLDQLQVLDDRRQLVRDVVGQFEALFRRELGRRLAVQDQGAQRATPATKRGDDGRSEPDGALEGECQSGGGPGVSAGTLVPSPRPASEEATSHSSRARRLWSQMEARVAPMSAAASPAIAARASGRVDRESALREKASMHSRRRC